jgi:WhiB family redox-sensing transcriptional regulator
VTATDSVPVARGEAGAGATHDPQPACYGTDLDLWFPDLQSRSHTTCRQVALARSICARCEVREPCLRAGMNEPHGLWGGLLPAERERLRHNTKET